MYYSMYLGFKARWRKNEWNTHWLQSNGSHQPHLKKAEFRCKHSRPLRCVWADYGSSHFFEPAVPENCHESASSQLFFWSLWSFHVAAIINPTQDPRLSNSQRNRESLIQKDRIYQLLIFQCSSCMTAKSPLDSNAKATQPFCFPVQNGTDQQTCGDMQPFHDFDFDRPLVPWLDSIQLTDPLETSSYRYWIGKKAAACLQG